MHTHPRIVEHYRHKNGTVIKVSYPDTTPADLAHKKKEVGIYKLAVERFNPYDKN